VARISFQFRSRFWERDRDEAPAFFHENPDHYFPTWWALTPLRAPVLVGWQGGPRAEEVLARPVSERVQLALHTLEKISGRSTTELRAELVTYSHHDWSHDPYSRGAYSYVAVGGAARARRLADFFGHSLFFAGEATMEGSSRGTVHGAIRSGERAARKLLRDGLSNSRAA
jgi:monoamine oxidase